MFDECGIPLQRNLWQIRGMRYRHNICPKRCLRPRRPSLHNDAITLMKSHLPQDDSSIRMQYPNRYPCLPHSGRSKDVEILGARELPVIIRLLEAEHKADNEGKGGRVGNECQ
jgi:hypothetical protein